MSVPLLEIRSRARLVGGCGVASAVLLLAAPYLPGPTVASVVWLTGLALMLPFLAGIATAVRGPGNHAPWLSPVIVAAGAVLVTLHLVNAGVQYTANNLSKESPVHEPLHAVGGALFTLAMLPLGLALVSVAILAFTNRTLPRWLAAGAVAVGATALTNGTALGSEAAWGFLLSLVWVLAAGVRLLVRQVSVGVAPAAVTAAG